MLRGESRFGRVKANAKKTAEAKGTGGGMGAGVSEGPTRASFSDFDACTGRRERPCAVEARGVSMVLLRHCRAKVSISLLKQLLPPGR